jgi:hypothetical protein
MGGAEIFDPVQMQSLFDVGFALATAADGAWQLLPPGRRLEP